MVFRGGRLFRLSPLELRLLRLRLGLLPPSPWQLTAMKAPSWVSFCALQHPEAQEERHWPAGLVY